MDFAIRQGWAHLESSSGTPTTGDPRCAASLHGHPPHVGVLATRHLETMQEYCEDLGCHPPLDEDCAWRRALPAEASELRHFVSLGHRLTFGARRST